MAAAVRSRAPERVFFEAEDADGGLGGSAAADPLMNPVGRFRHEIVTNNHGEGIDPSIQWMPRRNSTGQGLELSKKELRAMRLANYWTRLDTLVWVKAELVKHEPDTFAEPAKTDKIRFVLGYKAATTCAQISNEKRPAPQLTLPRRT